MIKDKNGCCGYMDLICYQCSGGNYPAMDSNPKGVMEYIREQPEGNRRSHVYTCKDCGYNATYSTKYVGEYELR